MLVGSLKISNLDYQLEQLGITLTEPPRDELGRLPEIAAREDIVNFHRLFEDGFARWRVPPVLRYQLDVALGRTAMSKRLLLSNATIRERAAITWTERVGAQWQTGKTNPNRRWWFVTFVGDCGNALEYAPVVDLEGFRTTVLKMLSQARLHALGAVEVQALTNFPQKGLGLTLMFHAHVIAWTDDPSFDHNAVEQQLCQSTALRHWLGAQTVKFQPTPNSHRQLTWKAYYMLKPPVDGKYLARSQLTPSGYSLNRTNIRKDVAVRLMECLTQLEWSEMVFATGDGVAIRDAWLQGLKTWHKGILAARPGIMHDYDMAATWSALRRGRRGIERLPFVFAKAQDGKPSAWQEAAELVMAGRTATRRYSQRNSSSRSSA